MAMMLVEAYAKGIIKVGSYIGYNPDKRKCILSETETGWNEEQIAKTQHFKYQFAGIIFGQVLLLADGVTKPICLKGMIGHKNGPKSIQRYTQECFSCEELGAIGVSLTEPMFEKLPEKLQDSVNDFYWLGSPDVYADFYYAYFGVSRVFNGRVYGHGLHYSNGLDGYNNHGVRPAVVLPSDIQIDENKKLMPYKG